MHLLQDILPRRADVSAIDFPTVSVILPNYNHARFIGTALSALAAQSRQPQEILVIDDASTDDSLAVIESFKDELPQLRVLRNVRNEGVNAAINRGLFEAHGSHVVCTAADDWLEPDFIALMSEATRSYPEGRVCVSNFVQYYEDDRQRVYHRRDSELGPWYVTDNPQYFSPHEFRRLLKRGFVWLPLNAALVDRTALLAINGYDHHLRWHSDWFATYTLAFRHGFTIVPEPLSVFRVASSSYSATGMRNPQKQRQVCAALCDKLNEPEFADIRLALRDHPVAMSTFFRPLVRVLATRPREWPYLAYLVRWWVKEVSHGRRPRVLRELTAKFGNVPFSRKIQV
jgi:glycosyltransferase involved in cell wall biosynthesis